MSDLTNYLTHETDKEEK